MGLQSEGIAAKSTLKEPWHVQRGPPLGAAEDTQGADAIKDGGPEPLWAGPSQVLLALEVIAGFPTSLARARSWR